jgi:hypothetical protein
MPLTSRTFDQLINFTRTSAATFVGSNGLIQTTPQSVNLLTYTQEFDNAVWVKSAATVTANSTTAPDGTSTADTLLASAGTGTIPRVGDSSSPATVTSTTYTVSVYAKAGTYSFFQIYINNQSGEWANFTLSGAGTATANGASTATITALSNGWYRLSMTYTAGGTDRRTFFMLAASGTATRAQTWNPTGTETIFLWGAQLEVGSTATTYTRNFGGLFPPRFDYDPVTLAPRGLLIEEQRTNLQTYSADFTNAVWAKTNITVTAAAAVSPDGTSNAQKIEATASAGTTFTGPATAVAATAATFSVYAKQGTGATTANAFLLRNNTTATNLIAGTLNYSTGVWTYTTGSTGVVVTNAGNGWWRVQITATSGITSGNSLIAYVGFTGGAQTAGNHLFAWGAQLEANPFASSYIPTVASQVTRTSDQPTIAAPNFAPWYNSPEGTLVTEYDVNGINTSSEVVATISDNTSSNLFLAFVNSGGSTFVNTISGGVTSANVNAGLVATNTTIKLATVYRVNDFAASQNGAVPVVDTTGAVPVGATTLNLGWAAPYGGLFLNGRLRRLFFYPTRLTNAQLQALST